MWGFMGYLSLLSVLPVVDDHRLSPCVEKQCVAPTGKQSTVLLNATDYKIYFSQVEWGPPKKYESICPSVCSILKFFCALHCCEMAA